MITVKDLSEGGKSSEFDVMVRFEMTNQEAEEQEKTNDLNS